MKTIFKVLRLCLLIATAVSLLLTSAACENKRKAEYESRLSQLLYEKQSLINEKERIALGLELELGNNSYMSLMFAQLDAALYDEVFPIMSAQSDGDVALVGVMALSEDELPGYEGNITLAEYRTLVLAGWGSALYWDGVGEIADFIMRMRELLLPLEIELPKSLIFASGTYSAEYDDVLLSYGIENAIHSGENELAYIEETRPDGVWHPGRIGWRCFGTSTRFKEMVEEDGGYALFEIGFDNSPSKSETSFFPVEGADGDSDRVEVFARMVTSFKESISEGKISVGSIETVRSDTELYHSAKETAEAANAERVAKIDAEIAAIQKKITDLYNEYN